MWQHIRYVFPSFMCLLTSNTAIKQMGWSQKESYTYRKVSLLRDLICGVASYMGAPVFVTAFAGSSLALIICCTFSFTHYSQHFLSFFSCPFKRETSIYIGVCFPLTLAALITVAVYDCALSPQAPPRDW